MQIEADQSATELTNINQTNIAESSNQVLMFTDL